MKNGQNTKSLELVLHHSANSDDAMIRRLKNRERQRRYRLRKKMEADTKKEFTPIQPSRPQEVAQITVNQYNHTDRVYCKRNWKKDARNAYASRKLQESPVLNSVDALQNGHQVDDGSETKAKLATRDWKAEARRKKI